MKLHLSVPSFLLIGVLVFAQEPPSPKPLVEANTRFAFAFLRQAALDKPKDNLLTAPTALSLDFELLQNIATGQTRNEMFDVFSWQELSSDEINRQSASLATILKHALPAKFLPPKATPRAKAPVRGTELMMAGSFWGDCPAADRCHLSARFLAVNKQFFHYDNKLLAGPRPINDWMQPRLAAG